MRKAGAVRAGLLSGLLMMLVGIAALLSRRVLLFPSLGPTAVVQAHSADHKQARIGNVLFGHLVGAACAFAAVLLLGLGRAPSIFALHYVSWLRVAAATFSITVATTLELLTDRVHIPAASTTLLVALGSFKWAASDVVSLLFGIGLIATAGEVVRRIQVREFSRQEQKETRSSSD